MGFASLFVGPGAMLLDFDPPDTRGDAAVLIVIAGLGVLYLGFSAVRVLTGSIGGSWLRRARDPLFGAFVVAAPLAVMKGVAPAGAIAVAWFFPVLGFLLDRRFFLPFGRAEEPEDDSLLRTRFLDITLDPVSGILDGQVIRGRFAGRILSGLSPDEVDRLIEEASSDPDTVSMLTGIYMQFREAGAGRAGREEARRRRDRERRSGSRERRDDGPPRAGGAMEAAEAYRVLGLEPRAGDDQIIAAHRRLMKLIHPDAGGSDYLASKVNEARDLLLGQ